MFKWVYILWVFKLFDPIRFFAYHIPPLAIAKSIPSFYMMGLCIVWLFNDRKKNYNILLLILLFHILITIYGLLFDYIHLSRAKAAIRVVLEYYLLWHLTYTYINDYEKIRKLLRLIQYYFLYCGVCAVIFTGTIPWDLLYYEEDALGPLMCSGAVFSFYYLKFLKERNEKTFVPLSGILLCTAGVVASFARGSFIALVMLYIMICYKEKKILTGLLVGICGFIILSVAANIYFPDNAYWKEMKTISGSMSESEGTGRDRRVLWSIAWEEFKDNPVIGVGPYNFGMAAPRYLSKVKDKGHYNEQNIWGRALHSTYFQVLCEQGFIGFFLMSFLRAR